MAVKDQQETEGKEDNKDKREKPVQKEIWGKQVHPAMMGHQEKLRWVHLVHRVRKYKIGLYILVLEYCL